MKFTKQVDLKCCHHNKRDKGRTEGNEYEVMGMFISLTVPIIS